MFFTKNKKNLKTLTNLITEIPDKFTSLKDEDIFDNSFMRVCDFINEIDIKDFKNEDKQLILELLDNKIESFKNHKVNCNLSLQTFIMQHGDKLKDNTLKNIEKYLNLDFSKTELILVKLYQIATIFKLNMN